MKKSLIVTTMIISSMVCATAYAEDAKPTITVWQESANEEYSNFLEAFESDEFDVDIVYYSSEDLKNQVRISLASGEGPDIMQANTGEFFNSIMAAGQALALDDYVEKYGWADKVESAYLDSMSTDGTLYGLPLQTQSAWGLMFYNKDFFEENGLEISMYPTVDEIVELSGKISELGKQPIALGSVDLWPGMLLFGDFLTQKNGQEIIDALYSGEKSWDCEEVRECLEYIAELGQNGCFQTGYEAQDHSAAIESFVNGTSVMMYMGTWWLTYVDGGIENLPFEYATVACPRMSDVEVSKSSQIWCNAATFVNADTEYADYCAQFLDYLASDEAAQAQYDGAKQPTFSPSYNENMEIDPQLADSEAFQKVYELERVNYMDWNFATAVTQAVEIEISKLMMGDTTIDDAIEEIVAVAEEELE